jgi:mannose-6-phosphate isomerase-like protein (cupin superfamily)
VAGHDHLTSPNLGGLDKFAIEPEKVDKPWGHEVIWAKTERYVGKTLFLKAGESLSLQFHKVKDEAWYILAGRAEVELGAPGERMLNSEVVGPGAAFHFPPGTVHRVTAVEDTTILEVSTPDLDDIVRLEDRYGREGTTQA